MRFHASVERVFVERQKCFGLWRCVDRLSIPLSLWFVPFWKDLFHRFLWTRFCFPRWRFLLPKSHTDLHYIQQKLGGVNLYQEIVCLNFALTISRAEIMSLFLFYLVKLVHIFSRIVVRKYGIFFWKLCISGVYFFRMASWICQLCDFTASYVQVHLPLKYIESTPQCLCNFS